MLTPEQSSELMATVTRIDTKMELLISNGGSKGMVPELRAKVDEHDSQIAYWKGAVAVVGFLLLVFGGVFVAHVLGGTK